MLLWIVAYLLLAIVLLAVVMLPSVRDAVQDGAGSGWSWGRACGRKMAALLGRSAQSAASAGYSVSGSVRGTAQLLARRKWLTAGVVVLIAGPPLIAFGLRRRHVLEFAEDTRDVNQQIALLLNGEQLVPPAPLPPDVFVTAEVAVVRPNLMAANRDWSLLDADFRQRLLVAYRIMATHGYQMALLEGYRSPDRQNQLAGQDGAVVTNAAAYQSYHQYGLAADSAFYRDGKLVISEQDPWAMRGYALFGDVAKQLGLTWGGNWRMRDYGHVEWRRASVKP